MERLSIVTIILCAISLSALSEELTNRPDATLEITNIILNGPAEDGSFTAYLSLIGTSCGGRGGYALQADHVKTAEEAKDKLTPEMDAILENLKKDTCEGHH